MTRRKQASFNTTVHFIHDPESVEKGRIMHEAMFVDMAAKKIKQHIESQTTDAA